MYMSPEQLLSGLHHQSLDTSTDIYSAGLIFVEILGNKHGYNIKDYNNPYFLLTIGDQKDDGLHD